MPVIGKGRECISHTILLLVVCTEGPGTREQPGRAWGSTGSGCVRVLHGTDSILFSSKLVFMSDSTLLECVSGSFATKAQAHGAVL